MIRPLNEHCKALEAKRAQQSAKAITDDEQDIWDKVGAIVAEFPVGYKPAQKVAKEVPCQHECCGYNVHYKLKNDARNRDELILASTRKYTKEQDPDGFRDMDGFDIDEELARLHRALQELKHPDDGSRTVNVNALQQSIVLFINNIDEWLIREGRLPKAWAPVAENPGEYISDTEEAAQPKKSESVDKAQEKCYELGHLPNAHDLRKPQPDTFQEDCNNLISVVVKAILDESSREDNEEWVEIDLTEFSTAVAHRVAELLDKKGYKTEIDEWDWTMTVSW